MDVMQYIPAELGILVVALYIIGMLLKRTPKVADWLIPWVLMVLGIVGSMAAQSQISAQAILQGIIASAGAGLGNQLIKQTVMGLSKPDIVDNDEPVPEEVKDQK